MRPLCSKRRTVQRLLAAPSAMQLPEKPFSLRLPPELVVRVDECAGRLRASGLAVSRTDVARMLIVRALDVMGSDLPTLLSAHSIAPSPPAESEGRS